MAARWGLILVLFVGAGGAAFAAELDVVAPVEAQPLGGNCRRLLQTLELLGRPLPAETVREVEEATRNRDAQALQRAIDPHVLLAVEINPESRVKVTRGPASSELTQGGYSPVLVKIVNQAELTQRLRILSPQSGPVYSGAMPVTLARQQQTELIDGENSAVEDERIFDVEMYSAAPMTPHLSGLLVEYAIGLIYCSESGKREAVIGFDVGQGTQDLGFRGETPVLFTIQNGEPVRFHIRDLDGAPTTARLVIRDQLGGVHPPQAKRRAPDFFFQPQIYRKDGETILLAPGEYTVTSCRGPEYVEQTQTITVSPGATTDVTVNLQRWVEPMRHGWYCGDHHIHGAGCSHYSSPTEGVTPEDMFPQVKGEGLNVGCVLTWGPCFDFQRQFFSPVADTVSEPLTLIKYDLEISGFGSQALGHICLLDLKDQTYPGSEGTKTQGWPTWTVPAMRWAKEQGGVTGYPHSNLGIEPKAFATMMLTLHDANQDEALDATETESVLLPAPFRAIDLDQNGRLSAAELESAAERGCNQLPNLVVPTMAGAGAMEVVVSTAEGVCDFISAMDTARIGEWNTWYHLMNCGFPLKLSGETDFPCMSSQRVGQGRVYVKMADGPVRQLDYSDWCRGIAEGRSYVSDGFAHALDFRVGGREPGPNPVELPEPGKVEVTAKVSFAPLLPEGVAYGTQQAPRGLRISGDTINLHAPRSDAWVTPGEQLVEIVRNGVVVGSAKVPADGRAHEVRFEIDVDRSSWVALRQFPQLHTNPVNVIVDGAPIRASRESALWCAAAVEQLWRSRNRWIADAEKPNAKATYDRAIVEYLKRAEEASPVDVP